ncbi:MAG: hypothetical protein WCR02_11835, partial [Sphaerochaetaceae bacterium]
MRKMRFPQIVCILVCSFPLFGVSRFTVSLASGAGWYMGFPLYEDTLPFRSSYALDAVFDMGLQNETLEVSLEIPFRFVSRSPFFNGTSRRAFFSVGGGLRLRTMFSEVVGMFFSASMQYNWYLVDQAFLSFDGKLGPLFVLWRDNKNNVALEIPLGLQVRKDILGVSTGFLIRYTYN